MSVCLVFLNSKHRCHLGLVKMFIRYLFLVNVAECGVVVFSSLPAGLPDPFAKVVVDGSGQCHSTDTVRNTLDPKWNQHYDL